MIPGLNNTSPLNPGTQTAQPIVPIRLLQESGRLLLQAVVLPEKLPPLLLGEYVTARFAERLKNNQVAVLIKNSLFTLNLPEGVDAESHSLTLRVVGLKPTLTFALVSAGEAEHADTSVEVILSRASRYLTSLLQSGKTNSEMALLNLNVAQQSTERLAQQLKQGIEKSGLFYESHLNAWINGKRSSDAIKDEPQVIAGRANLPVLGQLLQQQLSVLENHQILLQGYAWPGQPMALLIEQEEVGEREANGECRDGQAWCTNISLNLPVLGELSACIKMVGSAVYVSFVAHDVNVESLIKQQSVLLQQGLESAGLDLALLTVNYEARSNE